MNKEQFIIVKSKRIMEKSDIMSEKGFIYILEKYPFYEGSRIVFVSDNIERTLAEFEKIKEPGYGYMIKKYPTDIFWDDYRFGEIVKHQELRADGLYDWNGDDWQMI